jgi:hypothetical protein
VVTNARRAGDAERVTLERSLTDHLIAVMESEEFFVQSAIDTVRECVEAALKLWDFQGRSCITEPARAEQSLRSSRGGRNDPEDDESSSIATHAQVFRLRVRHQTQSEVEEELRQAT